LRSIAPEDALYVMETWVEGSIDFVMSYLRSRAVPLGPDADLTAALRDLASS
jgi:hypothetical protein